MSNFLRRVDRLDLWAAFLGVFTIWLLYVVISETWKEGAVAWLSGSFGILVAFLFLHGVAVLNRVRKQGRVRFLKVTLWLLALTLLFSLVVLPSIYLGDAELILHGVDFHTPLGVLVSLLVLWIVFFVLALGLLAAACSAMWFLVKALRWSVPGFLHNLRTVSLTRKAGLIAVAEGWTVALPRALDPKTLRLDPRPLDADAAKTRFVQAMVWQLVLGMLLAVYISLNPVLLQSMSFQQTFGLVSITSI